MRLTWKITLLLVTGQLMFRLRFAQLLGNLETLSRLSGKTFPRPRLRCLPIRSCKNFLPPFVILLSGGLLGFSWWIEYSVEKYLEQTVEEDLMGRFELLAIQPQLLEEFVESGSSEVLQAFVKKTRVHISYQIPNYWLLSDSSSLNPPKGDRFSPSRNRSSYK